MGLTATDLDNIRLILKEEVRAIMRTEVRTTVRETVQDALSSLEGKATALENDVKAIYFMLAKLEKGSVFVSKEFQKFTLEAKLLKINSDLLAAAKQAGIALPR